MNLEVGVVVEATSPPGQMSKRYSQTHLALNSSATWMASMVSICGCVFLFVAGVCFAGMFRAVFRGLSPQVERQKSRDVSGYVSPKSNFPALLKSTPKKYKPMSYLFYIRVDCEDGALYHIILMLDGWLITLAD